MLTCSSILEWNFPRSHIAVAIVNSYQFLLPEHGDCLLKGFKKLHQKSEILESDYWARAPSKFGFR